jgi:hypothetical protein
MILKPYFGIFCEKFFFFEKSNFVLIETMNGRKDYGKTRRKIKVNLSFR